MSIGCTHSASNVKRTYGCNGLKVESDMVQIDGDDGEEQFDILVLHVLFVEFAFGGIAKLLHCGTSCRLLE
jgi:hypothetical protein